MAPAEIGTSSSILRSARWPLSAPSLLAMYSLRSAQSVEPTPTIRLLSDVHHSEDELSLAPARYLIHQMEQSPNQAHPVGETNLPINIHIQLV